MVEGWRGSRGEKEERGGIVEGEVAVWPEKARVMVA